MNAQEIFDTVVTHLRNQGCKAKDMYSGQCMYRAPNGLKCAAGCLISDDEYIHAMEGRGFEWIVPTRLIEHTTLIADLQEIHDGSDPIDWENGFSIVAARYRLEYSK